MNQSWMSGVRFVRSWLLTSVCCSLASCSSGNQLGIIHHDEELFPVQGTVLFEGKPVNNAAVIFYRSGSTGEAQTDRGIAPNPHGDCDESGEFKPFTYMAIDGVPEGIYAVTVSWKDPEGSSRDGETYPELLPRRYQDPKTSGLKAEIVPGENILPPFELTK